MVSKKDLYLIEYQRELIETLFSINYFAPA